MDIYTFSLAHYPHRSLVQAVVAAALDAVDPYPAVSQALHLEADWLTVGETKFPLAPAARIWVVGAGKAGYPMAKAAAASLHPRLADGLVVVKDNHSGDLEAVQPITIVEASHPVPDMRGARAAVQIQDILTRLSPDDLVICLVSGGGSALLSLPVPGVSLADLQNLTSQLLACGANIQEINTIRKHLDQLKGGQLARQAAPARLITLILSDVVGSSLEVIASGPTVPDPSTYAECLDILAQYNLVPPTSILRHLQRGAAGEIPETPKPGDPCFATVHNLLVGSNAQAAAAAMLSARKQGWHPQLLTLSLVGEAREAAAWLVEQAQAYTGPRPALLVAGGETTVTLRGSGKGGRNQELALAAVEKLSRLTGAASHLLLTLATDGGDGPTDAAGAVISGETLTRARAMGLDPAYFLANNDAYHFFQPLGDLLITGPTQTNVNDLAFLFLP